jgi:hypothetical protein
MSELKLGPPTTHGNFKLGQYLPLSFLARIGRSTLTFAIVWHRLRASIIGIATSLICFSLKPCVANASRRGGYLHNS